MDRVTENVFEFIENSTMITATVTQKRFINRLRSLAKKFPEQCEITVENPDGSIVAHFPVTWLKINPQRQYTEEQKIIQIEAARKNFGKKKNEKQD